MTASTGRTHAVTWDDRARAPRARCGMVGAARELWRVDIDPDAPVCRSCRRLVLLDLRRNPWNDDDAAEALETIDAGPDWVEAWTWIRRHRPRIARLVDVALELITASRAERDPEAHTHACDMLAAAVDLAAEAFTVHHSTRDHQETKR